MSRCPDCSASLDESDHTCPACGVTLEGTSAPTKIEGLKAAPRTSEATVEIRLPKFLPGDVLAGRYRLVSFLGRGGMGEIYQVEDLKLGQTVALKFLPEAVARNGAVLARFHREVRLARQVSHPNVCRVFDVGEAHGRPFLSMEFIRGNDLQSLLREGRLAPARALDIGWQLCAGLAAIHDAGILHRDLKPSNVMIDERGRVRITDFGVAALAEESHPERSGTPAYMAPEQAATGQVSIRSDLYSLGLVLYEMSAGRKAFEPGQEQHHPVPLSSRVVDLDPTAERTILRCLEKDPLNRPSSAAEVARAFSVDPLAAALASGEVPSPEMVALAQGIGDLSPAKGAACLAAVFLSLLMLLLLSDRFMAHRQIPLPLSSRALAERAHSLLAELGYQRASPFTAYGFEPGGPGQPLYWFWYRESPRRLQPVSKRTTPEDPPRIVPGEAYVELDTEGHLRRLEVLPEVGRPVSLKIDKARPTATAAVTTSWTRTFPDLMVLPCLLGIMVMTRRHLRLGIGDLNGAWRLASILFFISFVEWIFLGRGFPTWRDLTFLGGDPALAWCIYLAIEPLLRRRWPERIVSWTRLLAGHVRNPMVGRDILAGCMLGLGISVVAAVEALIASSLGQRPRFRLVGLDSLLGVSGVIRQLCADLHGALTSSLAFVIFLLVFHLILRRERWAIVTVAAISLALIVSSNSYNLRLALLAGLIKVGLLVVIWLRFGLLADLTSRIVYMLVLSYPLTRDPSDWYAGTTLFVLLAVSSLAIYGFVVSTVPSRASSCSPDVVQARRHSI